MFYFVYLFIGPRRRKAWRQIYGDDTEFWFESGHPFEIVEQRPIDVAADVDAIVNGAFKASERALKIFNAASVVGGSDSVFGDVNGHTGFLAGIADYVLDTLRVVFPANLGEFRALGRR